MGMGYRNVTYVFIEWSNYFTLETVRYSFTGRRRASFFIFVFVNQIYGPCSLPLTGSQRANDIGGATKEEEY